MARAVEISSSLPGQVAQNIVGSVANGLTATGSSSTNALVLPAAINYFTTVSASTGCIVQAGELPGTSIIVSNGNTGQNLTWYPASGETVNNAATSFTIAANKTAIFFKVSGTVWQSILTA